MFIAHPDKTVWKWILFWKSGSPQINFLYSYMNPWFKVQSLVKYQTLFQSGWWDIPIFVLTFFVVFSISYLFITMKPQTFVRNHTCIPKSQTMLLRFLQLLEVNTIGKVLVAISHWLRLICENGNSQNFFSKIHAFE